MQWICVAPLCLLAVTHIKVASSLFEDQIGRYDWKKSYVGKVSITISLLLLQMCSWVVEKLLELQ